MTMTEVVSLNFSVGDMHGDERCINFTLIDDRTIEEDEIFTVSLLATPGSGHVIGNTLTTVSIINDDSEAIKVLTGQ